jgi:hypothetical protein
MYVVVSLENKKKKKKKIILPIDEKSGRYMLKAANLVTNSISLIMSGNLVSLLLHPTRISMQWDLC